MDRTFAVLLVAITVGAVTVQPASTGRRPHVGQSSRLVVAHPVEAVARYNQVGFLRAARTVRSLRLP